MTRTWLAGACFALAAAGLSFAQTETKCTVSGQVVDSETGTPLENVNLFLSHTTLGCASGTDGRYRLTGIPRGEYELVVSRVGYELQTMRVDLLRGGSVNCDFRLRPKMLPAQEIQIEASEPEEWKHHLKTFLREFLGETDNAEYCTILNPEVLDLRIDPGARILRAATDSVLHVENRALGYRIDIVLERFEHDPEERRGTYAFYPKFEELLPANKEEAAAWSKNRRKSYTGSLKHFLHALVSGHMDDEMFAVYTGTLQDLLSGYGSYLFPDKLNVVPEEGTSAKRFSFWGWMRVDYMARIPPLSSFIRLKEPSALIDSLGNVLNPLCLEMSGYWARNRVAELLPLY